MSCKPMVLATLLLIPMLTGAGCSERTVEAQTDIMPSTASVEAYAQAEWSCSDNGDYAIRPEIDSPDSIYRMTLKNFKTGDERHYPIVGLEYSPLWDPSGQRVCIKYSGRSWTHYGIIDLNSGAYEEAPFLDAVLEHFRTEGVEIPYECNDSRPDPYLVPLEWSPDGTRLLVWYSVQDQDWNTQSGVFVYAPLQKTAERLLQLPASIQEPPLPEKPAQFKWQAEG